MRTASSYTKEVMPALMELDLRITEKQNLFIHSDAFETLFGGAAS